MVSLLASLSLVATLAHVFSVSLYFARVLRVHLNIAVQQVYTQTLKCDYVYLIRASAYSPKPSMFGIEGLELRLQ